MKPKIYLPHEHKIVKDNIDPDAIYVVEKLKKAGHEAYLVGGCVRDLLLGRTPKDFDVSTSALPEQIKPLFRRCFLIGRRFLLAHVQFGEKVIEVSSFRKGDNEDDSLIVRDNDWGTEEEDVIRRDFTINGLFYNPSEETIIDYVQGYEDAKKKYLRTIGNPSIRFKQDPVRMIRLIKFQARFGIHVDREALEALLECRYEILKSAKPRIVEEVLRMLESGASQEFFRLLVEYGFLPILIPHLSEFLEKPESKEIYALLHEVDKLIGLEKKELSRAALLSCLVFPIVQKHLQLLQQTRHTPLHLGHIQEETQFIIQETFFPSFQIPKRLFGLMLSILTTQFRFTPLQNKKQTQMRLPVSSELPLSFDFFYLRARIDPQLYSLYEEWYYIWQRKEKQKNQPRHRRR